MAESAWLLVVAALCALSGMARLALAMPVHWQQVHGAAAPDARASRRLRIGGGSALLAALLLCLAADHVSMAALVWVMLVSASALCVAVLLAYRPRWLRWLGVSAAGG